MSQKPSVISGHSIGVCDLTGKSCFVRRADAKRCMRVQFPSERMSVYRCEEDEGGCGYFHIGHTPYLVRRGVKSRNPNL